MSYALRATVATDFDTALADVRTALSDQGFGVLTEIDLAATLGAKLGVTLEPQVILGACRPQLAHAALQVEESIGLLLPCSVVVRQSGGHVVVEALDPAILVSVTGNEGLTALAAEVRQRLTAALALLGAGGHAEG